MPAPDARPFRVLGVQQVAIGGVSRAPLRALWCDLLGVEKHGEFESVTENVREDLLRLGAGPFAVEVDLMEPVDPSRAPRVDRPALNHVALWVDDLAAAYQWLSAQGVRFAPGGIRRGAAGRDVCFIHPRGDASAPVSGEGVLIELVQAPADVVAAHGQSTAPTH